MPKPTRIWVSRFAGLFILALPFLPLSEIFGVSKGLKDANTAQLNALSTLSTFVLAWLICFLLPKALFEKLFKFPRQLSSKTIHLLLLIVLTIALYTIDLKVFNSQPHLLDSIVQYFQAKVFAVGKLKASSFAYPEFFMTQNMLFEDAGWFSQYPPLHSMLLALGVLLGSPSSISVAMALVTAHCLSRFTRKEFGETEGAVTLVLCLISPFFLFMSASYMNHVSALMFLSVFLLNFQSWETNNNKLSLCIATLFGAAIFLIRPLTALALLLPFLVPATYKLWRLRSVSTWLTAIGSFGAVICFGLWFNLKTTGSPFLLGYVKLWGKSHGLGFHTSPWGESHTPILGLKNELADLQYLQQMLFEWPIPSLLPLALFLLLSRNIDRRHIRLLLGSLFLPLAYFFYWHRDAFLGPRFMYESIGFLLPLSSVAIVYLFSVADEKVIRFSKQLREVKVRNYLSTVAVLSLAFFFLFALPNRVRSYSNTKSSFKKSVIREARAAGIEEALIFIKVSWGNRFFARFRGLGVEPSLIQKAYSSVDHCLLFSLLLQVDREHLPLEVTRSKLKDLIREAKVVRKVRINDDPTLRLEINDLDDSLANMTAECREELRYDGRGEFTVYTAAFKENSPLLEPPFVVARDLRKRNSLVAKKWPQLKAYLYDGQNFRLIP